MPTETKSCPRCGAPYTPYGAEYIPAVSPPFPALSRRDNKTYVCSGCGTVEALEDFGALPPFQGPVYWDKEEPCETS